MKLKRVNMTSKQKSCKNNSKIYSAEDINKFRDYEIDSFKNKGIDIKKSNLYLKVEILIKFLICFHQNQKKMFWQKSIE